MNYDALIQGTWVHLGKGTGGWAFSFQGSDAIRTFEDWCALVRSAERIESQYGDVLTADEMIALAQQWQGGKRHADRYPEGSWIDLHGYSFTGHDFT